LVALVGVGRGERPQVFQKAVREYDILLIRGVENMLNMGKGQSTIAQVLVDESPCEFDTVHHTSLLAEKGIAKPLENMLVVFICRDVINADKGVEEVQMSE
jgi:hypothetical protein